MPDNEWLLRLVYLLGLLLLIGPAVWLRSRQEGTTLRYAAIWLIIGAAIFLAVMLYEGWAG